jgi:cytochrome P450
LVQWVVHRDPRFYDDPQAFRPARWTDEFRENLHPFAYFPFSGGPRRCLGDRFAMLELRLIVTTLLQRFHLAATVDDLELAPALTLRPAGGLEMRTTRR